MIEARDLTREYKIYESESGLQLFKKKKRIMALSKLSFTACEGRNVGILGMNGAGKSTLIKLLCGIIAPTHGEILVDSKYIPFEKKPEYLKKISLISGNKTQLNYDLSARDNFRFLGAIYGVTKAEVEIRADFLAKKLGSVHLIDRQVRKMSFGERLKMEVVASLLHDPQYIFLDEPTIGLDVRTQDQLREFIRNYNDGNKIIFITSHNLEDISAVCDDILFINRGKMDYYGGLIPFCSSYSMFCTIKIGVRECSKEKVYEFLNRKKEITNCATTNDAISFDVARNHQVEIIDNILRTFLDEILFLDVDNSDMNDILKKKILEG